jgi:K+-transporting ATPase A subunit
MVFILALAGLLAGLLAGQRPGAVTVGTLWARGVNFVILAGGAAVILALLNFLPAFSPGPLSDGMH